MSSFLGARHIWGPLIRSGVFSPSPNDRIPFFKAHFKCQNAFGMLVLLPDHEMAESWCSRSSVRMRVGDKFQIGSTSCAPTWSNTVRLNQSEMKKYMELGILDVKIGPFSRILCLDTLSFALENLRGCDFSALNLILNLRSLKMVRFWHPGYLTQCIFFISDWLRQYMIM